MGIGGGDYVCRYRTVKVAKSSILYRRQGSCIGIGGLE